MTKLWAYLNGGWIYSIGIQSVANAAVPGNGFRNGQPYSISGEIWNVAGFDGRKSKSQRWLRLQNETIRISFILFIESSGIGDLSAFYNF